MSRVIDYYASLVSPWTYMGHQRIQDLAKNYGAKINLKPVEFGVVFGKTGGLPLPKRAPERQKYRFQELERWRKEIGIELNLRPKYFPASQTLAALLCLQAKKTGLDDLQLAGSILRAVWAEDRNIADENTLLEIAENLGFDGKQLLLDCDSPEINALYENYTNEAVTQGVFGAPSYVIGDEIFWGQDRLMFVDNKLKEEDGK